MDINTAIVSIQQFNRIKGEFVAQGTTLTEWCKKNSVSTQNVRSALLGSWNGPKALDLRLRIISASGMTLEELKAFRGPTNAINQKDLSEIGEENGEA